MSHRAAALTVSVAAVLDGVLGVAYAAAEHLSVGHGLYFAVQTATTVGYGDLSPRTAAGHWIAVAVMLTCVPLWSASFALFTASLTAGHIRRHVAASEKRIKQHVQDVHDGGSSGG